MYHCVSLGWGRQSTCMLFMAAFGDLPMPNVAIHSDTTHERRETYEYAERWTPFLEQRGLKIVTVKPRVTFQREGDAIKSVQIPAFTLGLPGKRTKDVYEDDEVVGQTEWQSPGGERGVLRRQCTNRWKIAPMRRWLTEHVVRFPDPDGVLDLAEPISMWLGISTDEAERVRPSDVQYIQNRYPLIEKGMSVRDCEKYLLDHDVEVPPKSSCVFCPFHNKKEWRGLRERGGQDWNEAVQVDEMIRYARPGFELFVHPSRKPLSEVGESIDAQPELLNGDECEGACFL